MQRRVAIIGGGIVGAMIAYELSQEAALDVLIFDQKSPGQGSTLAALGVLMGIISHKVKGRSWQLREASIRRYQTLIPELEQRLGSKIPYNPQGILSLCFDSEELARWQTLQTLRHQQGWPLEIWSPAQLAHRCPHLYTTAVKAAIYSPQDSQVDPTALTLALVAAAQQQGVTSYWQTKVTGFKTDSSGHCYQIQTPTQTIAVDWVIVASGLGSVQLTATLSEPVLMRAVLGQAVAIALPTPLGNPDFQPVINGHDVHIVPVLNPSSPQDSGHQYWLGASVEFPPESAASLDTTFLPQPAALEQLWQVALGYCPALQTATVLRTWTGYRPRPHNQAAPVIKPLTGFTNVTLATGHYRNGVLLAPATAALVKAIIQKALMAPTTKTPPSVAKDL